MKSQLSNELQRLKYLLFIIRGVLIIVPVVFLTVFTTLVSPVPIVPTTVQELALWTSIFFLLSLTIVGGFLPYVLNYSWNILRKISQKDPETITELENRIENWD